MGLDAGRVSPAVFRARGCAAIHNTPHGLTGSKNASRQTLQEIIERKTNSSCIPPQEVYSAFSPSSRYVPTMYIEAIACTICCPRIFSADGRSSDRRAVRRTFGRVLTLANSSHHVRNRVRCVTRDAETHSPTENAR